MSGAGGLDLDAIVCNHRWDDKGEPVCNRHGYLWLLGAEFCNGFDADKRALVAEVRALRAKVARVEDVAVGRVEHRYMGGCPDTLDGFDRRDPECPACAALEGRS